MKRPLTFPLLVLGSCPLMAQVEITPLPPSTETVKTLPTGPASIEQRQSTIESIKPRTGGEASRTVEPTKIDPIIDRAPKTPAMLNSPEPTKPETTHQVETTPQPSPSGTSLPTASGRPQAGKANKAAKPATAQPDKPASTPNPGEDPVVRYNALIQPGIVAFENKRYTEAYQILKQALPEITAMSDVGMLSLLGYAAMHANDETTSLAAFKQAAETAEDDQFYQSWVDGLIHFKRLDEAEHILRKMQPSPERDQQLVRLALTKANTLFEQGNYTEAERLLLEQRPHLDAGGLELLGWIQYRAGKIEAAVENFETAYRKTPSKGSAQGLVFSLHRLKRYAPLPPLLESVRGPLDELIPPATREALAQGQTRFNVDAEARLTPSSTAQGGANAGVSVRLEPSLRHKQGIPGEGRLQQAGVIASIDIQDASDNIKLQIERHRADNAVDDATGQRFYALWRHSFENGFESRLGVGRSLSGGPIGAATLGEIGLGYYTADWGLGGRIFRRANQESLLALVGLRDLLTGLTWGRVLETGLSLDGYRRLGDWNALISLTRSRLTGEGVADNTKSELYARALHPIPGVPGLALGPELYTSRFDKNLSAFEPGHGGYFSPERFIKIGALASYETQLDQLELKFLAGLGWGWSRQAAADGNPLTGAAPDKYPSTKSDGVAYHARLDGRLPLSNRWSIGFSLGGQKSPDYTDWRVGVYTQHDLE